MSLNEPNTVADLLSMEVATATHQFKFNYSKTKEVPAGESIKSPTFSVSGYDCNILYYPQGLVEEPNSGRLHLVLRSESEVTASFGFSFLDKYGTPASKARGRQTFTFSAACEEHGHKDLSLYLVAGLVKDGYFTIVCSVTILSDSHKQMPKQLGNGVVPLNINEHFAELLENKDMTDIIFEVDGELFTAHRLVLSARSPVFKAEFFGRRTESKIVSIQIKDIKPSIFKAMLHFIYSDSLPDMSDEDIPTVTQVQHLYKAADRYALDGLKMICEDRLIRDISINSVISSLALADEHSCCGLKQACLDYASKPENLPRLALKIEYAELMNCNPWLLKELN